MKEIRFEVWKSENDGQWYWHVGSEGNRKIIARSTDGYVNRADCLHSLQLVRAGAKSARVLDLESGKFID